jgi:hypothetical protein
MVIDYQGRVPRFVVEDDRLIHQITGCYVMLHERSDGYMREAIQRLKKLMYARGYSAGEILCSTLVGSYPIK